MAQLFMQQDPALERKKALAQAMMQRGMQGGPVKHWTQGLAKVLSGGLGAYMGKKADEQEAKFIGGQKEKLAAILAGGSPQTQALGGISPELGIQSFIKESTPKKREREKDASGILRYVDTGKPVFPKAETPKTTEQGFKQEKGLRGEFQGLTEDYRKQQEAFGRVIASADDPSPAGDLALIFNYMKILDPGSVVRESEFATAARAGSFGDRIEAAANQIANGEKLSRSQRADFVNRAAGLYEEATKGFTSRSTEYQGLSEQYELDPSRVVTSQPLYNPDDYASLLEAGNTDQPPTPMTDEAYNSIPSGAVYIDPDDGKRYRKP